MCAAKDVARHAPHAWGTLRVAAAANQAAIVTAIRRCGWERPAVADPQGVVPGNLTLALSRPVPAPLQSKLDRLFDKGYLRKSEVDQVLLDDIESERGACARVVVVVVVVCGGRDRARAAGQAWAVHCSCEGRQAVGARLDAAHARKLAGAVCEPLGRDAARGGRPAMRERPC